MISTLLVEYYSVEESQRNNNKYPKHCDECHYPPVWTVRKQIVTGDVRVGYGCSEHIDAVMMKVVYSLPPGVKVDTPAT